MRATDYHVGQRVELKPHLDLWMRGARYATVTKTSGTAVRIETDRGQRVCWAHPDSLTPVED